VDTLIATTAEYGVLKICILSMKDHYTLHSLKVSVWCAVSQRRIIGPIFFIEMITAEHYQELIMNFISLLEVDKQDSWLQQDGATAHTANSTMQMLSKFFDGHIIFQNLWPPSSLDLSPPDFYLWGFLKENTHTHTHTRTKQPTYIRRMGTKY
jgi:hypothetical protein